MASVSDNSREQAGGSEAPIPLDYMGEIQEAEAQSAEEDEALLDLPRPWVSWGLLIIIVLLYGVMLQVGNGQTDSTVAEIFGDKRNALIQEGQIWRLVTAMFLHGSLLHLASNGLSLLWLGAQIERIYGSRKYLIIYIVSGIAGFLASSSPISLGASGALFGIMGAGLIFPVRYRKLISDHARTQFLTQLFIVMLLNLALGFSSPYVDNRAHMGGLVGGAFMALWLIPSALEEEKRKQWREWGLNLATFAVVGVVGWAALKQWQWATRDAPPLARTYTQSPERIDPWWQFDVPIRWQPVANGWRSPEGAILQAIDSAYAFPTFAEVFQRMEQATGQPWRATRLESKVVFHQMLQRPQQIQEVYFLPAFGHGVALVLSCPPAVYPRVQSDFLFTVRSVQFRHPPTSLEPPTSE